MYPTNPNKNNSEIEAGKLELKHVVSCFLENRAKILILKRSTKVSTYKGKWATVSGYIENYEEAIKTAKREIEEEVGLNFESCKLIKKGDIIYARDGDIIWAIHPFLFSIPSKRIKLDWEHTDYKWISPKEVRKYKTVPRFKQALFSLIDYKLTKDESC